ncbi:hypothetical protein [Actinokineospora sp. NBRC 105648]|uniref:hypothetical protein n=1 Tax=Actinokineospora sp. NBRC 105648 TaxID=3032206 RepID=UPI0024A1C77B|nr:hypothetical protein [Actinokineospora sp. NBRC 105648]GLZ39687.1 hypothetical protein Acsp05_33110 [Actinokineospora sp. NBRC 105648]
MTDPLLFRHTVTTAGFVFRWCVKGLSEDGAPITTIFDLATDRRSVVMRPGAIDTFSLRLWSDSLETLAMACATTGTHAVSGAHPRCGSRTLTIRTSSGPAVTFTASVPQARLLIAYRGRHLSAITNAVAEINECVKAWLVPVPPWLP